MQIKIWHLSTSTQNSTVIDESKSSLLLFDIVSTTFIPGKISSEKRCRSPLPNLGRFTLAICLTLYEPETDTERQATQHGCLPSLLGDGDKEIEIVYGEENNIKNYFVQGRLE